tara:strand:- start:2731 stop:2925 length:195 start_codon:yes stop_codon:yes gene_type:complete
MSVGDLVKVPYPYDAEGRIISYRLGIIVETYLDDPSLNMYFRIRFNDDGSAKWHALAEIIPLKD